MDRKNIYLILTLLLLIFSQKGFSQTTPVTATPIIGFPPSIYLPDYYSAGSNKLTANLMLNDFNEPSRDVFLRISLESTSVRIKTRSDYKPAVPTTLIPGVLTALSGDDLEPCLNYNNISFEGIEYNTLIANGGKLPEGFYTFCIEVYDYATGRLISNAGCTVANLAQFEPPTLTTPTKGQMIAPSPAQNINFQWVNPAPIDPANTYYMFTLYELIDPTADPLTAISSHQAIVVHQEETVTTIFNYNTSHPLLEVGKTYIYTVQALTQDGRAMFKNNGVSEPSYFYYGYPEGGKITLLDPPDDEALELVPERIFSWSAPDNLLAGQNYSYHIKIAMIDSTRTYEEVLEDSVLVYENSTPLTSGTLNYYHTVNAHFQSGKTFVWQVTAHTGDQEIAKSPIHTFGGPPCILDFIAADEYITVTFTTGCDLSNLTGKGTVELFPGSDPQPVSFNNIRIERDGVQYYLREGYVVGDIENSDTITLNPEYARNGNAYFFPDSVKISRYNFDVKGWVEWPFPHAADQSEAPVIRSKSTWMNYDEGRVLGPLAFEDSTGFDLMDPMNTRLNFTEGSRFYIRGTFDYFIDFYGNIRLPFNVNGINGDTLVYPFGKHEQVFNIQSITDYNYTPILVANRTTLTLKPTSFILDLDNTASTGYFSGDPTWRGLLINEGLYSFNGDYAFSEQFFCNEPNTVQYDFNAVTKDHAYVINDGLYVYSDIDFGSNNDLFFNTFPALMDNFHIDVSSSYTNNGQITGGISIPLLDDTDDFPFTCNLSHFGFQTGYLNDTLDNQTFTFNEGGGEQLLYLTINRGYFANHERLETTVTLEWPSLGITFEQIPGFRIWGNYDIGFNVPGGAITLAEQLQTRMKGFEVTFDGIGAGRQGNLYSFGTTGKMVMGEDVSGDEGPPTVNLYSIYESSKIDETYVIGLGPDYTNEDQTTHEGGVEMDSNVGTGTGEDAVVGDLDAMKAKYDTKYAETEAALDALKPKPKIGTQPPTDNLEQDFSAIIPNAEELQAVEDPASTLTIQELIQIIDLIAPYLEPKQRDRLAEFKELITMFSKEEIDKMIEKFSDVRGIINKAIRSFVDAQLAKVTDPLKEKVDLLNTKISKGIMTGTDTLLSAAGKGIDLFINAAADGAISLISASPLEDPSGLIDGINQLSVSSRLAIKTELNRTVHAAVQKNIITAATGIVDTVLYTGTVLYLSDQISANAANLITNPDYGFDDVDIDFDGMVDSMSSYLSNRLTFDYFKGRINATLDDIYNNFNWDSVAALFVRDFAGSVIGAAITEKVSDAVSNALGDVGGAVLGGIAGAVEMDFSNLGDKLKSGDITGIVKLDPSKIVIVTPTVDLSGYVKFYEDDPVWGDAWKARLNAVIKVPAKFGAYAEYVNGSKPRVDITGMSEEEIREVETFKFWFLEVGVTDLKVQLGPLPILLTGANGKIYHHMMRQPDLVTYLPNDSIRFGAGLRAFMVDQSGGAIADFNVGLELEIVDGGFMLEMNGQALIANLMTTNDKGEKSVKKSLVYSEGFIRYNSVEKHLLGSLTAETQTSPLLCAGGGMIIDISKDWWQFAVGTRENPVHIDLLCRINVFKGWFDINKAGLDMGLFANIDIDVKSPWINIGIAKFRGWAYFYFDFESELVLIWSPEFGVQKARVYIDIGAGVGIDWKTLIKSGSFTIAAINLGGELEFATIPKAYLKGEVHGSVTVLGIKAGLSMSAEINF